MDKIYAAIKKACNSFTLVNQIECRHNGSLPLVDALTPEWEVSITKGQEEVDALIDHIIGEIKNVLIPMPDINIQVSNMLHQLNLDRADIAALPAGATISCNITTLRNAAALIKRLSEDRK